MVSAKNIGFGISFGYGNNTSFHHYIFLLLPLLVCCHTFSSIVSLTISVYSSFYPSVSIVTALVQTSRDVSFDLFIHISILPICVLPQKFSVG